MDTQSRKIRPSYGAGSLLRKGGLMAAVAIAMGASGTLQAEIKTLGPTSCRVTVDERSYTAADGTTTLSYNWEQNTTVANAPILVYLHGGSWTSYTQDEYFLFYNRHPQAQAILKKFNVVSVDYRKFVKATSSSPAKNAHPAQREDIIKFIRSIDTPQNRICLMGHSAGAHIAATVAAKLGPSVINCVVGISGTYDLSETTLAAQGTTAADENDRSYWGNATVLQTVKDYRNAATESATVSPGLSLTATYQSPTLLYHGSGDKTVDLGQSILFAQKIRSVAPTIPLVQVPSAPWPYDTHTPRMFGNCSTATLDANAAATVQFLQQQLIN